MTRCFPHTLRHHVGCGRTADRFSRTSYWPASSQRCYRSLGSDFSLPGRHWHSIHRRLFQRGTLLQHNYRLVSLLPLSGFIFYSCSYSTKWFNSFIDSRVTNENNRVFSTHYRGPNAPKNILKTDRTPSTWSASRVARRSIFGTGRP